MVWFQANEAIVQQMLILMLMAVSVQMVLRSGQFSLASIGFYTLGAYTTGILVLRDWAWPLVLVLVVLAAAVIGYGMARPLSRLSGLYLAMGTVAFDLFVPILALNGGDLTGGALGLFGIPVFVETWHLVLAVVLVCYLVAQMERGWMGHAQLAMRDDAELAQSVGIPIFRERSLVFASSAAIGALAGSMTALTFRVVSPSTGGFSLIVLALSAAIIGGRSSWVGAILGAIVLQWLPEFLRFLGDWRPLVHGVVLVLVILFAQDGLLGIANAVRRRRPPVGGSPTAPSGAPA